VEVTEAGTLEVTEDVGVDGGGRGEGVVDDGDARTVDLCESVGNVDGSESGAIDSAPVATFNVIVDCGLCDCS